MGVADRYLLLDKLTGGVTVQPDMQAVVNKVAGQPGGADTAYPGRTPALATGRSAYLLSTAAAPFTSDEFQQFANGQATMSYDRGGSAAALANSMLADKPTPSHHGLFGAITGAIGDVKDVALAPFKASLNALSFAYDEGISQPLSTLITLMSDGSQWQGARNPISRLMYAENWKRAYHIAEHRSPAQAAFMTFMTDDIFNQDQVAKAANTDLFRLGTGVLDGAFNWYLDPLTIATGGMSEFSKGLRMVQEGAVGRQGFRLVRLEGEKLAEFSAKSAEAFAADARRGRTFGQFAQGVQEIKDSTKAALGSTPAAEALDVARLQQRYLKGVTHGGAMAQIWASADTPEELLLATKGVLGSGRDVAALVEHNRALAQDVIDLRYNLGHIDALQPFEKAVRDEGIRNLSPSMIAGSEAQLKRLETKLDLWTQLDPELRRLENGEMVAGDGTTLFGGLKQAPGDSLLKKMAGKADTSELFQTGPFQNAVRFVTAKTPRNVMDVAARGSDARFDNMLRYIGVHTENERLALRGQFLTGNETQRWNLVSEVQKDAFKRMAVNAGMTESQAKELLVNSLTGQRVADSMSEAQRLYSAHGNDLKIFKDEDGVLQAIHVPLTETQTTSAAYVYDWRQIRHAMSNISRLEARIPGVTKGLDVKSSVFDGFMKVWKPSVLLSPRTGMRNVLLDEGIATVAKIRSAADLMEAAHVWRTQGHNLMVNEFSRLGINGPEALRDAATKAGVLDADALTVPELVARIAEVHGTDAVTNELEKINTARRAIGAPEIEHLDALKVGKIMDETAANTKLYTDQLVHNTKMKALRRGVVAGALGGYATGGIEGALIGAAGGGTVASRMAQWDRLGLSGLSVNGFDVEASIGDRSNLSELTRQEIAGQHVSIVDFMAAREDEYMGTMRSTGKWVALSPGQDGYENAWTRAVNLQLGQSEIVRRLLAEAPSHGFDELAVDKAKRIEDVARWLGTREGKKITETIPRRAGAHYSIDDAKAWVEHLDNEIERLTLGDPTIKQAMLNQEATPAMLHAAVPPGRVDKLPNVHGEDLAQSLGGGIFEPLKKAVTKAFGVMAVAPIEEMARIPYFDATYRAEMTRRLTGLGETRISRDGLRNLERSAREVAQDETKRMFYDATDRTDLHTVLRNMMPFLPAQQDAIERWGRITIDNPQFTARMRSAWMGLDKSVISVKDEDGNSTLQFRLPEFARGLVQHSPLFKHAFDSNGTLAINKDSLNMITGGGLGFGPITQLVASKLVEMRPELNDVVGWAIPYGANTDLVDVLSPAWLKRGIASEGDVNSRRFMNQFHMVLAAKLVDMKLQKTPQLNFGDPQQVNAFVDQAMKETKNLFKLQATVQFGLPVGIVATSPYAKQIEAYHQLQDKLGPEGVDAAFLEQYGEEFNAMVARNDVYAKSLLGQAGGDEAKARQAYVDAKAPHGARETFLRQYGEAYAPLTEGASKGVLPSTTEAYTAGKHMSDLVHEFPQLASLIVGKEGVPEGAKFNRAVFDAQFASGDRTLNTPTQLATEPETQLGWDAFGRAMDTLDVLVFSRGAKNGSMPKDLALLKKSMILGLAQKYPTWYADYIDVDGNKWANRIKGLTALANDPRAKDRPEMAGLRDYLSARSAMQQMLAARAASGRPASLKGNPDLSMLWNLQVQALVERSTDFGALHHRWLANDPLTRDPTLLNQAA